MLQPCQQRKLTSLLTSASLSRIAHGDAIYRFKNLGQFLRRPEDSRAVEEGEADGVE